MRKTQVDFSAEYNIECLAILLRIKCWQWSTCHEQAGGQTVPYHFCNPEGIPAQCDHRIDPDNLWLEGADFPLNLFKGFKSAIEYSCFNFQCAELAGQSGCSQRGEKQLVRRFCPKIRIDQGNARHGRVTTLQSDRSEKGTEGRRHKPPEKKHQINGFSFQVF